jgi:hypothetical protein
MFHLCFLSQQGQRLDFHSVITGELIATKTLPQEATSLDFSQQVLTVYGSK